MKLTYPKVIAFSTVHLALFTFLAHQINEWLSNSKFDTLGSPLLYPGGTLSLSISISFVFTFFSGLLTSLVIHLRNANPLSNSHSVNQFQENNAVDSKILDIIVLFGLTLSVFHLLSVVNSYYFYHQPFSLTRNYVMTASIMMFFLLMAIYVSKQIYRRLSPSAVNERNSNAIYFVIVSYLVFGLGAALKYWSTSYRLSSIFILFFVISSLIIFFGYYFADCEKNKQLYIAIGTIPLFVFFLHSRSYGDVKSLHAYESFAFSNAQLLSRGYLPWKDFSTQHGLWSSGFREYFGGFFVDSSIWGQLNGSYAFVDPLVLSICSLFIFFYFRNLGLTVAVLFLNKFIEFNFGYTIFMHRFLPVFILVFSLKLYIANSSILRLITVAAGLTLGVIWSGEFIYFSIGVLATIALVGFLQKWRLKRIFEHLFVVSFASLTFFFMVLYPRGVFFDYIKAFQTDADGYFLAWGMSFQWNLGLLYQLTFFAIPLALFFFVFKLLSSVYLRRGISSQLLPLLPIAVCSFLMYFKFLNWADWHLSQPANVLLILVCYLITLLRIRMIKLLVLTSVPIVIFVSFSTLSSGVNEVGYHPNKSWDPVVGHMDGPTTNYVNRIRSVESDFQESLNLKPESQILDLGNEPLSWFGISRFGTVAGVDKVLNIASFDSQAKLVALFEANPPKAIIWSGEYGYWDNLFNGTFMRQYLLSRYALQNYEPVKSNGKYVLLSLKGNVIKDPVAEEKMKLDKCDWALGAPRFRYPDQAVPQGTLVRELDATDNSILLTESSNTFSQNGFFVSSAKPSTITLRGTSGTVGELSFTTTGGNRPNYVWLGSCPAWFYQSNGSSWLISSNGQILTFWRTEKD